MLMLNLISLPPCFSPHVVHTQSSNDTLRKQASSSTAEREGESESVCVCVYVCVCVCVRVCVRERERETFQKCIQLIIMARQHFPLNHFWNN